MKREKELSMFFPDRLRAEWERLRFDKNKVREIRIRANQPVMILAEEEITLAFVYRDRELEDIFQYLCHDSVYAYDEERRQGYLTVEGGHRIGITGELVLSEGRYIVKYVKYMNIRIAHEMINIAKNVMPYLYHECVKGQVFSTLIISPPGIGKTTLLRDIIRLLSDGCCGQRGCNVGVVDERGELSGAYRGSASLDCGKRTDLVTGGTKKYGIDILVRTFSPRVVAIDEIGKYEDADAVLHAGVSGCSVLATVHGSSIADISQKEEIEKILRLKLIDRFIVLSINERMDRYFQIFDREGKQLCGKNLLQVPA